jgi:hypothetical protein
MPTVLDEQFDQEEDLRLVVRPKNIIKCNFCDWQVRKWKTIKIKKGKKIEFYGALQYHVMTEHPDEWRKIIEDVE